MSTASGLDVSRASPGSVLERFSLAGRVIAITGGAGLLGKEHAAAIAEAGGTPVLLDLDGERAALVAREISARSGQRVEALPLDVTSRASCASALARLLETLGRCDGLINNAALNPKVENAGLDGQRFETFPLERWQRELDVGLTGAFLASQIFGTHFAKQGRGVIVNVASDLGVIAPDQRIYRRQGLQAHEQPTKPATYSVIKGGLVLLTKYLATYWAEAGVRVNALSPGGVYAGQPQEFVDKLTNLIPLGRMASAQDYQAAVVFLCSDASAYMTGANLIIDGGRTCW